MIWTIDTGVYGAAGCASVEALRKTLEDAADHFEKTGAETAKQGVLSTVNNERDISRTAPNHMMEKATEARDAEKAFLDKMPAVRKQMATGIDVACALAAAYGGPVTASVTGHLTAAHPSGIERRIQVSVDSILPQDE